MDLKKESSLVVPGQRVRIVVGPLTGLNGTVVSHPFPGKSVLWVRRGIYLEIDDHALRIDEADSSNSDIEFDD